MGHNSKCFVPHCKTGYNSCKKRCSLFSAPKDAKLRKLWDKAICRADRKISEKDVVCAEHFLKTDIIKEWTSGDIIIPYKKPRLTALAVPSIFSYKPLNISISSDKTKKNKREWTATNILPKSAATTSKVLNTINSELVSTNNVFEELWLNRDSLKTPNSEWTLHYIDKNDKKTILITECIVTIDGTPSFLRNIILDQDLHLQSFLGSLEINKDTLNKLSVNLTKPTNISDIQKYVDNFSNTIICAGGPSAKTYFLNEIAIETAKIDVNGLWRHTGCPLIIKEPDHRCNWCKSVYDYFINQLLSSKS